MTDPKGPPPESHEPHHPDLPADASGPIEELNLDAPLEQFDYADGADPQQPGELPAEAIPAEFAMPADGEYPAADAPAEFAMPSEGEYPAADMPTEFTEGDYTAADLGLTAAEGGEEGDLDLGDLTGEGLVDSQVAGEGITESTVPEEAEAVAAAGSTEPEPPVKKRAAWLGQIDWIAVALIIVGIWAVMPKLADNWWWHALYLALLITIPLVLWRSRRWWTTPELSAVYTVMLVIAAGVLLSAVYLLGLELNRYAWDVKASDGIAIQKKIQKLAQTVQETVSEEQPAAAGKEVPAADAPKDVPAADAAKETPPAEPAKVSQP